MTQTMTKLSETANVSTPFQALLGIVPKQPNPLPSVLSSLTGLARLERATYRLGGDRSIQLSYSPRGELG